MSVLALFVVATPAVPSFVVVSVFSFICTACAMLAGFSIVAGFSLTLFRLAGSVGRFFQLNLLSS